MEKISELHVRGGNEARNRGEAGFSNIPEISPRVKILIQLTV